MREEPGVPTTAITECLRQEYALTITQIEFLPLGADRNTAVYRAVSDEAVPYFVKLRSGGFDETTVVVPWMLYQQGVSQIIPPIPTRSQRLWARLGDLRLIVYPFVEGRQGYEREITSQHWVELGRALRGIHSAALPPAITMRVPRETYAPRWRDIVRRVQQEISGASYEDAVSADFVRLLKLRAREISALVSGAEQLGAVLREQPADFVLCHADIHAGNMLIGADDALHIVDWDTLVFAPKERDLMFAGAGLGGGWHPPDREEALFYQGYGHAEINPVALVYYRYERIVQDIAEYCDQILSTDAAAGAEDRSEGLRQLTSQFMPGQVVEIALRSQRNLPREP